MRPRRSVALQIGTLPAVNQLDGVSHRRYFPFEGPVMAESNSGNFILLVEDNPDDAELAFRTFRDGVAIPILVMEDGQQALDFIYNTRPAPLLVLLDLNLPKISGL